MERSRTLRPHGRAQALYGMKAALRRDHGHGRRNASARTLNASSAICSTPRSARSRRARSSTSSASPSCRWPRTSTTSSVRGHADQPDAGQRACRRGLYRRPAAQRCPGRRRNRHRQDPSAIAIAEAASGLVSAGGFYNVVDLVNRLEYRDPQRYRQGRLADHLTRMDFIILDELGYLPFFAPIRRATPCSTSSAGSTSAPSIIVTTNLAFGEWPEARLQ